ncbi:hypothetical protein K450DRAFT_199469 [Umbelopsis ramanniana AG]|uniref:Methyltransferase domain-containing protein n=1 Tax=Umbelopsis ramanniana AG TaxID=1314678 RepID=A0AAD5EAN1_UMBRA|nr:uncharacterized protein K450DRAFT_199469 [Umbelopsis ramanniana AG]KAI8579461.1 hypothetical protein K450DRAFT_199469 [Umbelopsis ramanniana AG]
MGNKKSTLRFQKKSKKDDTPSIVSSRSTTQSNSRVMHGREFHNVESSTYVLPKDDFEKDRLHQQHFVVKEQLKGNILNKEMMAPLFEKGIYALDVGCGPGSWVLDMATDFPNSEFEGMDMAETFPTAIHPPNVHFHKGNLLEPLTYDRQFDFVQMRFFALGLRKEEWALTYKNIHAALKNGGYFQHVETTAIPETTDPTVKRVFEALASLQRKKGQEPTICAQLHPLAEETGFEIIHDFTYVVEAGWGSRADQLMADTIGAAIQGLAPFLAKEMGVDDHTGKKLVDQAIANFGPSKTIFNIYCFLARKTSSI